MKSNLTTVSACPAELMLSKIATLNRSLIVRPRTMVLCRCRCCGYEFELSLGKYGCASCAGDGPAATVVTTEVDKVGRYCKPRRLVSPGRSDSIQPASRNILRASR